MRGPEHVSDDDDGQRLDRWLRKKRPDLPFALVQKLLRKGEVRVNGKRVKPDYRLQQGDAVRMPAGDSETAAAAKPRRVRTDYQLSDLILYEDRDLLVLNKPSGLAVQGGSGLKVHLETVLAGYDNGAVPLRLVHRIDRETSGLLVVARTAAAARNLTEQFTGRDVTKIYWALVSPIPKQAEGHIDQPLMKQMAGRDLEKVVVDRRGRPAQTDYKVLHTFKDRLALVEFSPRTGRTHQIRVHAAFAGFPLLGDKKYGGDGDILRRHKVPVRLQLHARSIGFCHPRTGKEVVFTAPLSDDLTRSFAAFDLPIQEGRDAEKS